jgi:hypothetical protein
MILAMKTLTWFGQVVVLSAILLGIGIGIFIWRYGSLQAAAAVASGRPLLLSPEQVNFGVVNGGAKLPFEVTLRNETAESVLVLGVDDCCYCSLTQAAPITVPAFGRQSLQLVYTASGTPGKPFRVSIPLVTTSKTCRPAMELIGTVSSKPVASKLIPDRMGTVKLIPEPKPR